MSETRTLVVIPMLPAMRLDETRLLLTEKFVEGMREYVECWGGHATALLPLTNEPTNNLDNVEVIVDELPFEVEVFPFGASSIRDRLSKAYVVLGGPHYQLRNLSSLCAELRKPCIYNTECSLRTELQITRAENTNPLRLARRAQWKIVQEYRVRKELRHASALQCNGTPTYESYRPYIANRLLYFDSRTREHEIATDLELDRANNARRAGKPLRLAFSGRLAKIKGVDHLPRVAHALRNRSVDFRFSIFGGGPLESRLRRDIHDLDLGDRVALEGVMDFHSELLPRMKTDVDLFVCCHTQGDPSCTYLETMAAGVPVIGYANEAFSGILRRERVGWSVPSGSIDRLADGIAHLDRERDELAAAAGRALSFARQHSFEATFRRRVQHIRDVSDQFYKTAN